MFDLFEMDYISGLVEVFNLKQEAEYMNDDKLINKLGELGYNDYDLYKKINGIVATHCSGGTITDEERKLLEGTYILYHYNLLGLIGDEC